MSWDGTDTDLLLRIAKSLESIAARGVTEENVRVANETAQMRADLLTAADGVTGFAEVTYLFDEAMELAHRAVESDPRHPEAWRGDMRMSHERLLSRRKALQRDYGDPGPSPDTLIRLLTKLVSDGSPCESCGFPGVHHPHSNCSEFRPKGWTAPDDIDF